MDARTLIETLRRNGDLIVIQDPVDRHLEIAQQIAQHGDRPILFEQITGLPGHRIIANLCARREHFALALGVPTDQLLFTLANALEHPQTPPCVDHAPCQEKTLTPVDLNQIPILTHLPRDGGPYITAGALIVRDPDTGPNMAIHRLMQLDSHRFAARLVEGRGTHTAWSKVDGDLEVAICIGLPVHVLLAAAMSPPPGVNELHIAHALAPTPLVRAQTVDLLVPAEAEWVLEGRLTHTLVDEGPFLDLTETYDIIRPQPVIEIQHITHRRDPIYHALLPGRAEHKLLMGMPREPTIYNAVNAVCSCRNVCLTQGGMSWLHAVVQIEKQRPDDGRLAIEAAFRGHTSLKHVVIVDDDVNPFDPADVEWAIATRFQADRDLIVLPDQPGSSLDPSAHHVPGQKARTAKMGLDATIPWVHPDGTPYAPEEREAFRRIR